jgi:integrase
LSFITSLRSYSFDPNTDLELRNYTIVRLFLDTGMRLGELSRLQLNELNLDSISTISSLEISLEGKK